MAGWFSPQGKEVLTKFKPFYIWEGGKLVIPMDLRVGYSYDSHKELIPAGQERQNDIHLKVWRISKGLEPQPSPWTSYRVCY